MVSDVQMISFLRNNKLSLWRWLRLEIYVTHYSITIILGLEQLQQQKPFEVMWIRHIIFSKRVQPLKHIQILAWENK